MRVPEKRPGVIQTPGPLRKQNAYDPLYPCHAQAQAPTLSRIGAASRPLPVRSNRTAGKFCPAVRIEHLLPPHTRFCEPYCSGTSSAVRQMPRGCLPVGQIITWQATRMNPQDNRKYHAQDI